MCQQQQQKEKPSTLTLQKQGNGKATIPLLNFKMIGQISEKQVTYR